MENLVSNTSIAIDILRDDGAFVFHHPPKFIWERDSDSNNEPRNWYKYHFYLHVPFCRKICNFCTFERKQIRKGSIEWFSKLLDSEMNIYLQRDHFQEANIESVYLGGGTASLLGNDVIDHIILRLRQGFGLKKGNIEITLETEPGTKSLSDFEQIRKSGVNRISIGAQAFDDQQLKWLNRSHSVRQTLNTILAAKRAGFKNLHLDIMFGLPGQTMDQWKDTVQRTIELEPTHVSAYPLIVFPDELLDRSLKRNSLPSRPTSEKINAMREYVNEQLHGAGLFAYSTAEFARPGFECKYVKSTWDSSDYLGMGPGAYSRNGHILWENSVVHPNYEKKIIAGDKPIGKRHAMSPEDQLRRDIAMGLCLLEVDVNALVQKSGATFGGQFSKNCEELVSLGLISWKDSKICLTKKGIRYATYIMKLFTNR